MKLLNGISFGDRQYQVLSLLSEGMSNKDIASAMGVTLRTIETHLEAIYYKLNVRNRTEAAIKFIRSKENVNE